MKSQLALLFLFTFAHSFDIVRVKFFWQREWLKEQRKELPEHETKRGNCDDAVWAMTHRIVIDADGCPVVNEAIEVAKRFGVECLLLCDTAHHFAREGAQTLLFSKGADSVDFALVNLVKRGDVVVTQDYGLAAMCLARAVRILSQDGIEYTNDNIDALLLARHTAKKIRNSGGRLKGPSKRTAAQDAAFVSALTGLLSEG